MAKLVVEVLDAGDLMPKDGQGSASPFVEVEVENQRQRTQTKTRDLNPSWNEKLVFNTRDLTDSTIEVTVYNYRNNDGNNDNRRRRQQHHNNFLGRVRISGFSVPLSESEAAVQRYPLDKRGLFSNIRGDIALRIYAIPIPTGSFFQSDQQQQQQQPITPEMVQNHPFEEIAKQQQQQQIPIPEMFREINNFEEGNHEFKEKKEKTKKKKQKDEEEKEVRTFFSVGTGAGISSAAPPDPVPVPQPVNSPVFNKVETRSNFVRAAPANMMHMAQFPGQVRPEYGLVETRPPLAARVGGDKTATTYDLVEQMHFMYVNVVKARDLPVMDIIGSIDPYVEVKLGNYKGVTNFLEKNQNPVWNRVFAFSKERLPSNLIEVVVKDKDFITKDDFVGRVLFDMTEVPLHVPPDSPLAPQWYRLEDKRGVKVTGEIMLAVWLGTQADEAFPEAWHSDAHNVAHHNLANTRSKVYFSPKLYYLRIHVIEAQDVVPHDKSRLPDLHVRIQLGHQVRLTRASQGRNVNPVWDEELMFVASEPFDEYIIISIHDSLGQGKDVLIGRMIIPVRSIPQRLDSTKRPDSRWFNLHKPSSGEEEDGKKEVKFSSKIHLQLCMDSGYHVLDESTHFSSDLQPSSKLLRKGSIGILELGILSARNLLPMKRGEGRMTDAYCVAKYGNKWIRTRTLLDTLTPRWNEQYTWEVYDPCTVITIGVFDNCHINGNNQDTKDQRIGKVRIRLSTLETDRIYTHYYPLLVLTPSGLKKHGELHLAVRFTCVAWVNMVVQYGKPLLPKMHYIQPIPVRHIDLLRHQAMQIVAARLTRAEPPLKRETVEYMLDVDYHMWSLRKSKANFYRMMSLLSGISALFRWFDGICQWKNPITTCLVHILFLILVSYPELILSTIFLYLFVIGLWNYRFRPRNPPHMDARISQAEMSHPEELDEEFDTFPSSRPGDIVRMRYDRMRSIAGKVQTVLGDLATQGERAIAVLSWRDSRATAIFIMIALVWAVFLYITPFQVVAILFGLYLLRHPRFRSKMPSVPVNFFKRLPAKADMLL